MLLLLHYKSIMHTYMYDAGREGRKGERERGREGEWRLRKGEGLVEGDGGMRKVKMEV
jgi:hypothetical protein